MLLPHRQGQKGGHNGTRSPRNAARMPYLAYAPKAGQPHTGVLLYSAHSQLPSSQKVPRSKSGMW